MLSCSVADVNRCSFQSSFSHYRTTSWLRSEQDGRSSSMEGRCKILVDQALTRQSPSYLWKCLYHMFCIVYSGVPCVCTAQYGASLSFPTFSLPHNLPRWAITSTRAPAPAEAKFRHPRGATTRTRTATISSSRYTHHTLQSSPALTQAVARRKGYRATLFAWRHRIPQQSPRCPSERC